MQFDKWYRSRLIDFSQLIHFNLAQSEDRMSNFLLSWPRSTLMRSKYSLLDKTSSFIHCHRSQCGVCFFVLARFYFIPKKEMGWRQYIDLNFNSLSGNGLDYDFILVAIARVLFSKWEMNTILILSSLSMITWPVFTLSLNGLSVDHVDFSAWETRTQMDPILPLH